jgi:hypothetical protein
MSITKTEPKTSDIYFILNTLSYCGFKACIAGGYARDQYYGRVPRDCDIWVYGDYHKGIARKLVNNTLNNLGATTTEFAAHTSRHESRNDPCINHVTRTDIGIDIIYLVDVPNMQGVVDRFDFNINQYIMEPTTLMPRYIGSTPVYYGLTQVREKVAVFRAKKMCDIYNSIMEGCGVAAPIAYPFSFTCGGVDDTRFDIYPQDDTVVDV